MIQNLEMKVYYRVATGACRILATLLELRRRKNGLKLEKAILESHVAHDTLSHDLFGNIEQTS